MMPLMAVDDEYDPRPHYRIRFERSFVVTGWEIDKSATQSLVAHLPQPLTRCRVMTERALCLATVRVVAASDDSGDTDSRLAPQKPSQSDAMCPEKASNKSKNVV